MTGMEMCKVISEYWLEITGEYRSPINIWHYSPSGELFMVFKWYNEADMYFKVKDEMNITDIPRIMNEVSIRLNKKYDEEIKMFNEQYRLDNEL